MYNNELMINILMADGHTREEAEKFDVFLMNSHELPRPMLSEMVSAIPKQYSKARSRCRYSVG